MIPESFINNVPTYSLICFLVFLSPSPVFMSPFSHSLQQLVDSNTTGLGRLH